MQSKRRRRQEHAGAAVRGRRGASGTCTLLADFDLEQLTCVEWNAVRLRGERRAGNRRALVQEPEEAAQERRGDRFHRRRHARTRRRPDQGTRRGQRRGVPADGHLERRSAADPRAGAQAREKRGAEGRLVVVLSKVGRSEPQLAKAVDGDRGGGVRAAGGTLATARRLPGRSRRRAAPGASRAIRICAKPPSGWKRRCSSARTRNLSRAARVSRQPTISLPAKNCAISTRAVSGASEPCTEFSPIESAKSLRIVPAAAFSGLVAPITSR